MALLCRQTSLIAFCLTRTFHKAPLTLRQHTTRLLTSSSSSTVHLLDDEIERVTRDWFERIVVGWNLCPFADRPNREGKLTYEIVRGAKEETILAAVLAECILRQDVPGTTLVVAPECCPHSFEDYLAHCTTLEEVYLPKHDLADDLQIAPFHPLFEFADSTGVDVWTNRSPYPIFHILRETEVEVAVDKLDGDSSKVWKRNIHLLQDLEEALGSNGELLENVIRDDDTNDKHAETIQRILRENRFRLKGDDDS